MPTSRFILVALLLLLAGCASVSTGPKFSEVGSEPGVAVLYVYRLYTPPYMRKPDIKIGDVVVGELPTNSYTALRLKPGTYTIKTDWGFLDNPILSRSATLPVVAGKSYYVNFSGNLGITGTTAVTYGAHVLSGEVTIIPSDLAACSFIAPTVAMLDSQ